MKNNYIAALVSFFALVCAVCAQSYTVYETMPGTSYRDYSKPGVRVDTDRSGAVVAYPTMPGTSYRDYSQPGVRVDTDYRGNTVAYPTMPGTSYRDYSKPGVVIESNR